MGRLPTAAGAFTQEAEIAVALGPCCGGGLVVPIAMDLPVARLQMFHWREPRR